MPKKLLALALCFFLLVPIFALAADIDFSSYSKRDLEILLRSINYQLTLDHPESKLENIVYEDYGILLEYIQFEEKSNRFHLSLRVTNKSVEEAFTCKISSVALNRFFIDKGRGDSVDVPPQSSADITYIVSYDTLRNYPIKDFKSLSVLLYLRSGIKYQNIYTDTFIIP